MRILLRSFLVAFNKLRIVIFLLIVSVLIGTGIFQFFYSSNFDLNFTGNILDSMFATIALMFSMEIYIFPHNGELIIKLIYIIYPFLGLVIIGLGIIEFGMFTFTYRYRLKAWNEWQAKTMNNHTILVGLGNIGTRIVRELLADEIPTTVITLEKDKQTEFVHQLIEDQRVAIIFGDATQSSILKQANVKKARAILVVTNNDLINFKVATKAKEINPKIRTVIRAFDQAFSSKVTNLFDIDAAISTSAIAAPAFVATSYEDGIIQTLKSKKGETEFHLMEITLTSNFPPIEVGNLEEEFDVTILAVDKLAHPDSKDKIKSGSKLLLLGEIQSLRKLKAKFCL
ncbi:MAG: potassium channel family protein [Candidatus Hodarchaeota archaeon]